MHRIVETAFERTTRILQSRRATLERGAEMLLERETLAEADLAALRGEAQTASAQ